MRVDGLIFANEALLDQLRKDQAPEQVANVAFLPGIQMASLAMPDIHWGYGFCIGGVCATDPDEGGVISPGGVGYDINCLTGDTPVLHKYGYFRRIGEFAECWKRESLVCFDLALAEPQTATIDRWFGQKPRARVLRMVTESGDDIRATADHPFWTPDGMTPLGRLQPGATVGMFPFEGVPFAAPTDDVLVSESEFAARWRALGKSDEGLAQAHSFLTKRKLLPLLRSSPAVPILCKILGFVFGDGSIHFESKSGKGITSFHGEPIDLDDIRQDLLALGIQPSQVHSRDRHHKIRTQYAEYSFARSEHWFKVMGSGFAVLLTCLGAPAGRKARQSYELPGWLNGSPLWHRRLFLAALFGAELSTPATISGHGTVFGAPTLSLNKRPAHEASGRRMLDKIAVWLREVGVRTQAIHRDEAQTNADGQKSIRLRLVLSPIAVDLRHLWGRIGYEYNRKRRGLAALAVQYLKHKDEVLALRERAMQAAQKLAAQGVAPQEIYERLTKPHVNRRFLERSLYEQRRTPPRVGSQFPSFQTYCASAAEGRHQSGMVWERVARIEEIPGYDGEVYDFTVAHDDHNFIAGGFVVSNCGVRLMRSNLFYRDVKGHLRQLVDSLFRNIPTGVGRSGRYSFTGKELNRLLGEGAQYLQTRDLATQGDIDFTEAHGRLDGADPDQVSDHAKRRGAEQCGTLGSGNHFLEVQVVDVIYDEDAATVLGLEKDMVCVMIHSGSRGLGYQVCDDALAMLRKAPEKYGIALPDRQLACAPVNSPEGQKYIAAMRAAANFAWCNRQLLMWQAREVFADVFGRPWQAMHMNLVYDVCHNIAKFEEHLITPSLAKGGSGGVKKKVWVHRKGATRAFPPQHPEVPGLYRKIGQPVIIPGDMGRASWVLVGRQGSMERSFGTTCHGAGRAMSRTAAVKNAAGRRIDKELEARGIIARAQSRKGLAEEQPSAYKNVDDVVEVVHQAGLSHKVARMRPIGVIKG
ncbi:MAG: intein-containing RctB family protein [Gemmataceae bacterium]|nr:intein-containing RctB family protein [Gemmataceae bacterium]